METAIAVFFVVVIVLFLISVVAPMHSEKPFWRFIYRARNIMDAVSYWFMTGALILSALAGVVYAVIRLWAK